MRTIFLRLWVNKSTRRIILEYRRAFKIPDDGFASEDTFYDWIDNLKEEMTGRQKLAFGKLLSLMKDKLSSEAGVSFIRFVAYPSSLPWVQIQSIFVDTISSDEMNGMKGAKLFIANGVKKSDVKNFINKHWLEIERHLGQPKRQLGKRPKTINHELYYKIFMMRSSGISSRKIAEKLKIHTQTVQEIWQRQLKQWSDEKV